MLPFNAQVKCSCRLLDIIKLSNIQSWEKDGSFSLVAAWTFHLSPSTAPQKLVVAAFMGCMVR